MTQFLGVFHELSPRTNLTHGSQHLRSKERVDVVGDGIVVGSWPRAKRDGQRNQAPAKSLERGGREVRPCALA